LALPNLGSIAEQSLAGAVSTSTHGAGIRHGTISTLILEITLVLADSSIVTCSKDVNSDLFYASLCGLGSTGIFVSLKIQLCPFYHLQDEHFTLSFDDFMDSIPEDESGGILGSAEHVRAYYVPQIGQVKVSRLSRVSPSQAIRPVGATAYERWIPNWLIGTHLHQISFILAKYLHNFIFPYARFNWHFAFSNNPRPFASLFKRLPKQPQPDYPASDNRKVFTDRYDKLFTYDCGPRQYTFECAVPIQRLKETLQELAQWLQTEASDPHGLRHHFPIEIRPCEADEIWLSPAYHQRVVYIGVCAYKWVSRFFSKRV
jgi:L-gulonolactone oxidase